MVDDVTSGTAADKLGRLSTDLKLLRDVSITEVDQRSSATQFEVRLTVVEVKTGNEINSHAISILKEETLEKEGSPLKEN